MFMEKLKNEIMENENTVITENGAACYRTTGKELLDLNFKVTQLRAMSDAEVVDAFMKAFGEDARLAMKWLFYARDIRGGLGERRLFRLCFKEIYVNKLGAKEFLQYVPEFGRWDDLFALVTPETRSEIFNMVDDQMSRDIKLAREGATSGMSLLGKWMPSINASSSATRKMALDFINYIGISKADYRKTLSLVRKQLDVVEKKMSAKQWDEIDYSKVPARANLLYNEAFIRHDSERRVDFLTAVASGEEKINAGTLYPHEIVAKMSLGEGDKTTLEQLWKALPDYVQGDDSTIVVADGSGSMYSSLEKTRAMAIHVANALAIYFAERCKGQFMDKYITFSHTPQLVDLSKGSSLDEKLRIAQRHSEVANTNIEAVFDLILSTAINNKMSQEELPKNILIISDMEFDMATINHYSGYTPSITPKLMAEIDRRYRLAGYKIPRIVFWNVCSRRSSGAIPIKENELGFALVSGYSPAIANMVLSNKTDAFEALVDILESPRYSMIEYKEG